VRPSFIGRLKISKGRRDPESEGETEGGRGDIERKRVKGERLREAERDFTNKITNQQRPPPVCYIGPPESETRES
jgi:hypothetical protein